MVKFLDTITAGYKVPKWFEIINAQKRAKQCCIFYIIEIPTIKKFRTIIGA